MTTSTRPRTPGWTCSGSIPTTRPQDDLFGHVNGQWLRTHEIPDDRSQDGAFRALRDRAEADVRAIVEEAAARAGHGRAARSPTSTARSWTSSASRPPASPRCARCWTRSPPPPTGTRWPSVLGRAPARRRPRAVRRVRRHRRQGLHPLPGAPVPVRARAARRVLLPRGRLRRDPHRVRRAPGPARRAGRAGRPGRARRRACMELETALAARSWDRVTNRDAEKTYTLMTGAALRQHAPDVRLGRAGRPGLGRAGRRVRRGHRAAAELRRPPPPSCGRERPLEQWQGWLAVRTASAFAEYLNEAVVEEDFDFYGRTLSGTPQLRERWKRGVSLVEGALGEAVGQLYVERHFPAAAKERMVTLVANLVEAYRQSIGELDWMGPQTRERALAKLARFTPEDRLPGPLEGLLARCRSSPTTCSATSRRAGAWATDHELAKIGKRGRPRRVADDPADGQRLLPPADERDRLPGGDPAAAVLRPGRRRRGQLRRDRRGDRPRDRPRLRRPGLPLRRRRQHDRLVDPGGPGRVRPPRRGADRAVQRAVPARAARRTRSTAR